MPCGAMMNIKITGLRIDAGGEGSRGGVVIGRTSGGKPIYKNHEHPSHSSFTAEDHFEARKKHFAVAKRIGTLERKKGISSKNRESNIKASKQQEHHHEQARLHSESWNKLAHKEVGLDPKTTSQHQFFEATKMKRK